MEPTDNIEEPYYVRLQREDRERKRLRREHNKLVRKMGMELRDMRREMVKKGYKIIGN